MRLAIIVAPLFLISCSVQEEQTSAPANETVPQAAAVSPSKPTLRRLTTAELAYAVGAECPTASRSAYKGKTSDQVFYAVQCGGRGFLVSVKFDGNSSVLGCSLAAKLGTPCWKPW